MIQKLIMSEFVGEDEGKLKGIPVDICGAKMDPLDRSIQAKLINSGELLDAIPGALPVYFESEVEMKVEQLSGAIIGGESQSIFWLDTRNTTEQQNPPAKSDLQQVFMIKTSAELDDETAETMESQIVTNQDMFAFFTNFDHWVDYVALSMWVLGLSSVLLGVALIFVFKGDEESDSKWGVEPNDSITLSDNDLSELGTNEEPEDESRDSNQIQE